MKNDKFVFLILLTAKRKKSKFAVAMTLADLSGLYGGLAQTKALIKELAGKRTGNVFLQGLRASSAPLLFCGVAQNGAPETFFCRASVRLRLRFCSVEWLRTGVSLVS